MPLRTLYRLALGAAAVVTASDYVLDVLPVTGDSMAPTLSPDYHETGRRDVLLFDKWMSASRGSVSGDEAGHAQRQRIRRGDVVSFWAPHKPERRSVKRVVALEGDTVFLDSRAAGAPLSDLHRPAPSQDVVVVPFGHVWVEGDNAGWSVDSRTFGPVSGCSYVLCPWYMDAFGVDVLS